MKTKDVRPNKGPNKTLTCSAFGFGPPLVRGGAEQRGGQNTERETSFLLRKKEKETQMGEAKRRSSSVDAVSPLVNRCKPIHIALLKAMLDQPSASQRSWANAIVRAVSNTNAYLKLLRYDGLVEANCGKWAVTAKGRVALGANYEHSDQ